MKIGDKVKIKDCSYAINFCKYERNTNISYLSNVMNDIFEIIDFVVYPPIFTTSSIQVHDVIIKNTRTGDIYLHSKELCKEADLVEVSRKDALNILAEHFGCKEVKIID